ncbi:hypothetical protein WJX72_005524 [[Myrmecia] bisecta]|uniref:PH domain-containing protein n=1 Tax=[Myrmecia] bisecta TaxID=41462 RepID=A0AAW1PQ41_9CHLO
MKKSTLPQVATSPSAQKLRKYYDPRRWSRRSYEGSPPAGYLWVWLGRLKRWKRRFCTALSPGVLMYYKSPTQKGRQWTINLQGASVSAGRGSDRQFVIKSASGAKFYLRAVNKKERAPWMDCIQKSITTFATLLDRASVLWSPTAHFAKRESSAHLARMLSGELTPAAIGADHSMLREVERRLQTKTEPLARHQAAFTSRLAAIQQQLQLSISSLSLEPAVMDATSPGAASPAFLSPRNHSDGSPLSASAAAAAHVPVFNGLVDTEGRALEAKPAALSSLGPHVRPASGDPALEASSSHSTAQLSAESLLGGSNLAMRRQFNHSFGRLESFRSATSQAALAPASSLAALWQAYTDAVAGTLRDEVTRIVELEQENAALKKSVKEFKERMLAEKQQVKRFMSLSRSQRAQSSEADAFEDDGSSQEGSGDDGSPNGSASVRSTADEMHDTSERLLRHSVSGVDEDFFEALEALEAIQTHSYVVKSSEDAQLEVGASQPSFSEPPEGPASDEESEDDAASDTELSALEDGEQDVWEVVARRQRMPVPRPLNRGFSIWSVLKNAIGRDLTRITMPATINEPLSACQRITEELEFRSLLDQALACPASIDRLVYVAVFVLSSYSSALLRESKPFNPLLGETYEWQAPGSSCRFMCEQVSHHPPITCWWSEGGGGRYHFYGEMELRSKFWGKSVELLPTGQCWLDLQPPVVDASGPLPKDHYSWNKATSGINNIIMGKLWLDWYGEITVRNHTTGEYAVLNLPKCGGRLEERGRVAGRVCTAGGATAYTISGSYMKQIYAQLTPEAADARGGQATTGPQLMFEAPPPVEDADMQYNLTRFAITLNNPVERLLRQLPPTDSRFRTDQRALEVGDLDRATPEKLRLEEKQRETRKKGKAAGHKYMPKWFTLRVAGQDDPLVRTMDKRGESVWVFTGDYWACRETGDWSRCPDIYGDDKQPAAGHAPHRLHSS